MDLWSVSRFIHAGPRRGRGQPLPCWLTCRPEVTTEKSAAIYEVYLCTSISTQGNYNPYAIYLFFCYPNSHSPPLLAPNRHLRHLWGREGNVYTKILSTGGIQLPHPDLSCVPASASDRPGEVNRGSVTVSQSQRQQLVWLHHKAQVKSVSQSALNGKFTNCCL